MAKEKDIFESIDLDTAMKEVNLEGQEASEEDLKLANIGFNLQKVATYKKQNDKTTVMFQNFPTNDFLDWYIDEASNNAEVILLSKHPEFFRELQNKKINNSITKNPETKNSDEGLVARYIDKNQELIAEKDKLFKKVQELQEERDTLKEKIENDEMYLGAAQETELKLQDERTKMIQKIAILQDTINKAEPIVNLAVKFITIFRENKLKTDKLTEDDIKLVKELSK